MWGKKHRFGVSEKIQIRQMWGKKHRFGVSEKKYCYKKRNRTAFYCRKNSGNEPAAGSTYF
jgi:hypothetical protein